MNRPSWNVWPPVIFTIIVLSFLAATGLGQWRMRTLDKAVVEIASTTAPGIEHLASARADLRSLQVLMRSSDSRAVEPPAVGEARRALNESVGGYLVLPVEDAERETWRQVFTKREALDQALARVEQDRHEGDPAARAAPEDLQVAISDLSNAMTSAIEFNAGRSRELALEIQDLRRSALYVTLGLDILCTAIAICGAVLLRRLVRAHDALYEEHLRLHAERASELEQFAGRVAHDILSPLSTVGFALHLAGEPAREEGRARVLQRGSAALTRVKRLVSGLLDFARAGAKPDEGACADLADVLADMEAELGPVATAAGVELSVAHQGRMLVGCNPGVLTSLVANLARNAMKYIGDGPLRRVDVRAFERGEWIRVEVEDTGPGLPPDVEDRVFDAYARSNSATQPGIGLGLATVKRLAEAHRGKVGVSSVPGKGCTFWFELPKAPRPSPSSVSATEACVVA